MTAMMTQAEDDGGGCCLGECLLHRLVAGPRESAWPITRVSDERTAVITVKKLKRLKMTNYVSIAAICRAISVVVVGKTKHSLLLFKYRRLVVAPSIKPPAAPRKNFVEFPAKSQQFI
jgi:hypothetical protein